MQSLNEKQSSGSKVLPGASGPHRNTKRLTVAAAIFVGLIVFGGYMYFNEIDKNAVNKTPTDSSESQKLYTQLEEYSLVASDKAGMSFKKPTEFSKSSEVKEAESSTASFTHVKDGGGIGFLTASSLNSKLASDKEYLAGINRIMNVREGEEFQKFIAPLYTFVENSTSPKLDVKISSPAPFKNGNIRNNAWQFEVSTQNKPTEKDKVTPVKGTLVLAIGEKAFYYFGFYAVDYNWPSTEDGWVEILESIKINQ